MSSIITFFVRTYYFLLQVAAPLFLGDFPNSRSMPNSASASWKCYLHRSGTALSAIQKLSGNMPASWQLRWDSSKAYSAVFQNPEPGSWDVLISAPDTSCLLYLTSSVLTSASWDDLRNKLNSQIFILGSAAGGTQPKIIYCSISVDYVYALDFL